ncbi:MAG TPA: hypothetical protein PKY59_17055 [Pyrinomonadaceae bacterium]|nr:hypothetical protein [Pyrinomonadaceae bacterium]
MKFKILLFLAFCSFICACNQGSVDTIESNKVMSSQVYQIYYVEGKKSGATVVATFRVGGSTGTTLALTEPGKVIYNGTALEKSDPSNLIGTNYRMKGTDYRTMLNNYQPKHEFVFTDNDGKTSTNSVTLLPLEVSANSGLFLDSAQPTTIPLSRAVGADETLVLGIDTSIGDDVSGSGGTVFLNPARNAVTITPQYWSAKKLGAKASIEIKVKKSSSIAANSNLGGSVSVEYLAEPIYVSVTQAKKAGNANANLKTANANVSAANANTTAKTTANSKIVNVAPKVSNTNTSK